MIINVLNRIKEKNFKKNIVIIKKGCTFAVANDASVAQLVEHLTLNQGVQGSTPCGSTTRQPLDPTAFFVLCFYVMEKAFRIRVLSKKMPIIATSNER